MQIRSPSPSKQQSFPNEPLFVEKLQDTPSYLFQLSTHSSRDSQENQLKNTMNLLLNKNEKLYQLLTVKLKEKKQILEQDNEKLLYIKSLEPEIEKINQNLINIGKNLGNKFKHDLDNEFKHGEQQKTPNTYTKLMEIGNVLKIIDEKIKQITTENTNMKTELEQTKTENDALKTKKTSLKQKNTTLKSKLEQLTQGSISKFETAFKEYQNNFWRKFCSFFGISGTYDLTPQKKQKYENYLNDNFKNALKDKTHLIPIAFQDVSTHKSFDELENNITEYYQFCSEQEVKNLVKRQDEKGHTLLHMAAEIGDYKLVKKLIKAGADVNAKAKNGYTPFVYALFNKENTKKKEFLKVAQLILTQKEHKLSSEEILAYQEAINKDPVANNGHDVRLFYYQVQLFEKVPSVIDYVVEHEQVQSGGSDKKDLSVAPNIPPSDPQFYFDAESLKELFIKVKPHNEMRATEVEITKNLITSASQIENGSALYELLAATVHLNYDDNLKKKSKKGQDNSVFEQLINLQERIPELKKIETIIALFSLAKNRNFSFGHRIPNNQAQILSPYKQDVLTKLDKKTEIYQYAAEQIPDHIVQKIPGGG